MDIKPYEKNQKKHPKKQIEQVANSIKEFGMNQPIVVDKQGVIIVGHGRYEALKLLKWEIKPEYIKVVDLTEEQAKSYRLADNKLNESEWDMSLVIEELKGLSEPMLELSGFDKEIILDKIPDNLVADYKDNKPTIKCTFDNTYDLQNAHIEIEDIINKYSNAYTSVSGGEL
jgi:ParB-like chromosome segregation protein Spo0J